MSNDEKPKSYRDLLVWQKGTALALEIYRLTQRFPSDERFGLTAQLRRAAVSVPSNIAEGQARRTTGEFIQFISNAEGSLAEIDTQVYIARQLGYGSEEDLQQIAEHISGLRKMLNGLRRSLS
ncbi:MAG: four helix bundle protein [Roseiflexus sp.]|nr:four helix bundle protein [Roseiflexus sp.]MCS7289376.1 four helix bundle protein [Roseiflexus sp.]MDW8145101.1 four helix bundle protein [Roseiflexaceae bacterium]MDW8233307.1 four helix bundle protein [Roseiflexaceae bacterium]